jgi:hypothetical protein
MQEPLDLQVSGLRAAQLGGQRASVQPGAVRGAHHLDQRSLPRSGRRSATLQADARELATMIEEPRSSAWGDASSSSMNASTRTSSSSSSTWPPGVVTYDEFKGWGEACVFLDLFGNCMAEDGDGGEVSIGAGGLLGVAQL